MKDYINNLICDAREIFLRYLYIAGLIIGVFIYFIIRYFFNLEQIDFSNIPGVGASFAGFLLTSYTIIISLPNNSFMVLLRINPIYKAILNLIIYSAALQLVVTIVSILNISKKLTAFLFVLAMVETAMAFWYAFKAFKYSSRSS